MATLNELGRNSASVTYGPGTTGADLFPTLQAVDTWFRNDTWQGVTVSAGVTAANAVVGNSSATNGTIWTTQARAGDYIMIAGQQKIVANVGNDQSLTVTGSFSPAITIPSAVKVISSTQPTQTAGYVSTIVRGDTNGTVYVTNGSAVINGVGTYFLAEATSSVTPVSVTGTCVIGVDGTITGTSTSFYTSQGAQNGLYPGDSISITTAGGAVYYFEIATVTDNNTATVTVPPVVSLTAASIAKATNGTSGRVININGRIRSIVSINSNTSMTVNAVMDFTDSNLRYKVYPRGTVSNTTAIAGTVYQSSNVTVSSTNLDVNLTGTLTGGNVFVPGAVVFAASGITAGTVISNQQWGAVGLAVTNTSCTGSSGSNVITATSATNIVVGMLVSGNGAAVTGVPAGTYVVSVVGTTVTLSNNLTAGYATSTLYFYYPGGYGRYTINQTGTLAQGSVLTVSTIQATGANWFWDLGVTNLNSSTATPYMYQTSQLDQIWINDEVRTINFNSFGGTTTSSALTNIVNGYLTDYSSSLNTLGTSIGLIRQPVYLANFKREDSYIFGTINRGAGNSAISAFLSDLRVGDDLIIDGTEVTVTAIVNDTQFKVNYDFTHSTAANSGGAATASQTYSSGGAPAATTFVVGSATGIAVGQLITGVGLAQGTYVSAISSTTVTVSNAFTVQATGTYNFYNGTSFYKKLKLHGYILEGTREGGTTSGLLQRWSQALTLSASGTVYPAGTTSVTLNTTLTIGATNNFIKISGAGGPPLVLTGYANAISASSTVTGTNTLFTSQLHVGTEIMIGGQYLTVTAIASDVSMTVSQTVTTTSTNIIYRTVPLYTYVTAGTNPYTLATPTRNMLYVGANNPPTVYAPLTGADYIEYVYSAPNYGAENATSNAVTFLNQSNDRKYVGFRMWPLYQNTNALPTATATIGTAQGAYATPVYERWVASYGQSHGVGINQADLSGGVMIWGTISATTVTSVQTVAGSLTVNMGVQGLSTGYPTQVTAASNPGTATASYTVGTSAQTVASASPIVGSLYGIYDITAMTQVSGGFLYLFGNKRYFAIQGRSASNQQTQIVGCLEFERAQPEDLSSGTGVSSGISFGGTYGGAQLSQGAYPPNTTTPGFGQNVIQSTLGIAPWPCFGYFNGNRFPTGAQQIPTLPVQGVYSYPIHGCVIAVPRIRNSVTDLVGFNAHIYSALTITTGRWGHQVEFGNYGTYANAFTGASTPTVTSNTLTLIANTVPQVHMGQIVPVYTNIYNAKRFMFSPVVVLGPAYDPDVRGRLYGIKVLPSALGTLMDTVSITVDPNYFYNTAYSAADHWVVGTPPQWTPASSLAGQNPVITFRFTLGAVPSTATGSWRSLEDSTLQNASTAAVFTNNFRYAFPA